MNLVLDAMSIKKAKIWNNSLGKFVGFIDYGGITKDEETKDVLIKTAIRSCHERGIRVHSLTFDGCAANLATMYQLANSMHALEKF